MSNPVMDRILHRWHIKVLSIVLATVLFWLYRTSSMEERFFSIPLEIQLDESFVIAQDHINNVRISLRGNEEIYSILEEDITAVVDFSRNKQEGSYREPVQIYKGGTALAVENLEIRVEPGEMVLYQEEKVERSLTVEPSLKGFPSLGYELTQFFVSPSSVTVIGPRSQMEDLDSIKTETIDISERYEDFTVSSRLEKPTPQILFPGGEVVEFRGVIGEAILVRTISNITIALVDLSPGLVPAEELTQGSITLQGSQLDLEKLKEEDISFILDCSGLNRPGTYFLPLQVDLPLDLTVLNYLPRTISLELKEVSKDG